jgi:serine protease
MAAMKRLLSSLSFALYLSGTVALALTIDRQNTLASSEGLFYNYGERRVSLNIQSNTIAVALTPPRRGQSAMSRLQQDFGGGIVRRGRAKSQAMTKVQAVDSNKYALLTSTQGADNLTAQTASKPYIAQTLPVLKVSGKSNNLILPNEVVISFKSSVSASDRESILKSNDIKSYQPLEFAPGFYVVTTTTQGLDVLATANRLNKVKGITSAIPNFIEVKAASARIMNGELGERSRGSNSFKISSQASPVKTPNTTDISTLQWHINSQALQQKMGVSGARTDVRAPEAWNQNKQGDGVVVAVIDNLLQWDHPALVGKIATVNCAAQTKFPCLPGEKNGWDFSDLQGSRGDNDTRANAEEIAQLQPSLKEASQSDAYLLETYSPGVKEYKAKHPQATIAETVRVLRQELTEEAVASFHGTMCAGMIVGNGDRGFRGIAPNAKILPVRAGGLGSGMSTVSIIRAIGYAAARGADVINMSFGSDVPNPAVRDAIDNLRQEFPKTVIVAAAGNDESPQVGFPAGFDGVISVGSINLKGNRAPYSNFGEGLDVVAPGGDLTYEGGVITLSGIGAEGFWKNTATPNRPIAPFFDRRGYYVFTDGTSFAAPIVAGVVALMKSADPQRKLLGSQYHSIINQTSSREGLSVIPPEVAAFKKAGQSGSPDRFFFANGLVNAEKAVSAVEKGLRQ